MNIGSGRDPVAKIHPTLKAHALGIGGLGLSVYGIPIDNEQGTALKPHPRANGFDHEFFSPTCQEALQFEVVDFAKKHGFLK